MNQHPQPLAELVSDAVALLAGKRTIRCPHPGCRVSVRYRHVAPDEAKRLTDLATDHTRH
ncbi:hypothetical protein [Streptomyces sp. XY332]|uniref:hypothetical protein n=1 Tax=Streptomyces sp. XY332 TaxID=1415561 RepID=UPI0003C9D62F|nr:hypothetical protein [Streptomyces sp. XY332]AGZ93745.1 hypothetical protein [Streptomyces sp. XY332]KOY56336.1 hypothetical protein ADK59_19565 [Streptomyces sp. XY332]